MRTTTGTHVLGTLTALDSLALHQVVLTLLGDMGNDASADGYANLARRFGSVSGASYTRALLAVCPPLAPRGGHTGTLTAPEH